MADRRFVFDTNVLVSAALVPASASSRALRAAESLGSIVSSEQTLAELVEVMRRSKFDRFVPQSVRDVFVARFVQRCTIIVPGVPIRACRDPRDDIFLELAIAARAEGIVTGDEDLLALHPFRGIAILTPRAFLDALDPREGTSA